MRNDGKSVRRKCAECVGQLDELGAVPASLRTRKGLSLREVEEATGKAVSNGYVSQLENGKIEKASPNVCFTAWRMSTQVSCKALMGNAG